MFALDFWPSLSNDPSVSLPNLLVGTAASLLAALVTFFFTALFKLKLPTIADLVLWRTFANDVKIVISEVPASTDPNRSKGKSFVLAPVGDALALAEISDHLRHGYKSSPQVASVQSEADYDRLKSGNLLIIGGPKYNNAARFFLTEMDHSLVFQFQRIRDNLKHIEPPDELKYKQIVSADPSHANYALSDNSDVEYGMGIIAKNPHNKEKFIICMSGLNQMSTLAISRWITKISGTKLLKHFKSSVGIQIIISCSVTDNVTVTNIKKLDLLPIHPRNAQ